MLRALEQDPHPTRLRGLERHFLREERFMQELLRQLQNELDHRQQQRESVASSTVNDEELLLERDELTEELDHVRTAIEGVQVERTRYLGSDPDDVRLIGA